ncbi:type 1 glutamine amidotransferase domain-containing protein, partial [Pantoea agglomerans]
SYTVQDGMLITGQNPGSSAETAKVLLASLAK